MTVEVCHDRAQEPRNLVRRIYTRDREVRRLLAIHQDRHRATPTKTRVLRPTASIRPRGGIRHFKEETESDLFGEQAVLCGGMTYLIKKGVSIDSR